MLSNADVVDFFKALGDSNRLSVFQLLLESDCDNSELTEKTGLRQNLLSHHLSVLLDAGLIYVHQSIGDARHRYYSANRHAARALCEWLQIVTPPFVAPFPALKQRQRVLFLCLRNSTRSLMAEALARHLAADALIVRSAGIESGGELPLVTVQVLAEHNVPHSMLVSQTYHAVLDMEFDYTIVVCDRVHENSIPPELVRPEYIHWSLDDPFEVTDDPTGQIAAAHQLFDEIRERLSFFVQRLAVIEADSDT